MSKDVPGFADIIAEAQRLPEALGEPGDLSSPFGFRLPPGSRVVDEDKDGQIPGMAEHAYEAHVRVFNICDQRDTDAYVKVLNDILAAKALKQYEDRQFTKEGDCLVALCWLTMIPGTKAPSSEKEDMDEHEELIAAIDRRR